jgi:transcriptional regulator GlxA family with amidase domain
VEKFRSAPDDIMRRAARWLEENCCRPVKISDAAAIAGMGTKIFVHRFERELGAPPLQYLLDLRLRIARRLLAETDLPLHEVARRAGISSRDQLARNFRLHFKILPSQYRAFHRDDGSQRTCVRADPIAVEIPMR